MRDERDRTEPRRAADRELRERIRKREALPMTIKPPSPTYPWTVREIARAQ